MLGLIMYYCDSDLVEYNELQRPWVSLMVKNVLQYCWGEEDFDVTFGDEFKKILSNLLRKGLPTNY